VQSALEIASRSRTTVCIAHRLSTIKNADNIIVMSQGQIVEQGSHDALYLRNGMYRGLVDAQKISAQTTGDECDTPEDIAEIEKNLDRIQSSPTPGMNPIQYATTRQLTESFQIDEMGIITKTNYSLWCLLKKG